MNPRHIFVIGAARSGTKLLRDSLATAMSVGKVPFDIGYIWRYGNEDNSDDVIAPEALLPDTVKFIRSYVNRYAAGHPSTVIEKTVGNTMRVPALRAVFPDALFVHIIRDGVDVIESARREWTAPANMRYLTKKLRHFPLRTIPQYGSKYVTSLAARRTSSDGSVGSWGPRYPGIGRDLSEQPLLIVCARQWRESVERARRDLRDDREHVLDMRYEDLVTDPTSELKRASVFLGFDVTSERLQDLGSSVYTSRQGTGRSTMTASELSILNEEIGNLLIDLDYPRPFSTSSSRETS